MPAFGEGQRHRSMSTYDRLRRKRGSLRSLWGRGVPPGASLSGAASPKAGRTDGAMRRLPEAERRLCRDAIHSPPTLPTGGTSRIRAAPLDRRHRQNGASRLRGCNSCPSSPRLLQRAHFIIHAADPDDQVSKSCPRVACCASGGYQPRGARAERRGHPAVASAASRPYLSQRAFNPSPEPAGRCRAQQRRTVAWQWRRRGTS